MSVAIFSQGRDETSWASVSHICAKALRYYDGIPFENQPILYGQLVAHTEVRVSVLEHVPCFQAILREYFLTSLAETGPSGTLPLFSLNAGQIWADNGPC